MTTIDHVTMRLRDPSASLAFYDRCFELLAFGGTPFHGDGFHEWNDFSIVHVDEAQPATTGAHVAFTAASRSQVDGWWEALTRAGHPEDGAPGPRPQYSPTYYGAFIRDPDGNSIEAVHHEAANPETGMIDHLWIRVADLAPTKRFYTAVAAATGAETRDRGEHLQVITDSGSFTLLAGPPTRNLHLAIGVNDEATVREFHRAGLDAGGRDNGGPGERPEYHAGYYGAYLFDPDGNNVEAVCHNR